MFCKKCGKEIPDDSIFCNSCGLKVEIKEDIQRKQPSINYHETSSTPFITIDQDLSFFNTFLIYKGKKYLYFDIKDINFSRFVASMNLVPYMNETGLFIVFDNDEKITYSIDRSLSRGKTSKLLEQAYYFLQKTTFNIRSNKLINTLNHNCPINI